VVGVTVLLVILLFSLRGTGIAAVASERLGWTMGVAAVAGAAVVALVVFDIVNYDLLAIGRLVVGAGVNLARALVHLAIVVALVFVVGISLANAVTAYTAAQLAAAFVLLALLISSRAAATGSHPSVTAPDGSADESRPIGLSQPRLWRLVAGNLKRGWVGQVSVVSYLLMLRLDQGLVAHFHGAAVVGVYSLAVWAGELLWLIPGALTPLLVHSSAASDADRGRDTSAARAVRLGLSATFLAAVPVGVLAPLLFARLSGGVYAGASPALWALLPGIVAVAPATVLAGDFIGRGHPAWNAQASVLVVFAGIALGLWLIPPYGAVGASIASSLSYACGTVLMLARFRRTTGLAYRTILIPSRADFRR
jgi:O-antigen/teichoic acid export membrane protein